jgi:hypothetical protein
MTTASVPVGGAPELPVGARPTLLIGHSERAALVRTVGTSFAGEVGEPVEVTRVADSPGWFPDPTQPLRTGHAPRSFPWAAVAARSC